MLLSILQGTRLTKEFSFFHSAEAEAFEVGKGIHFSNNDSHIFVFLTEFKTVLLWWILTLFVYPDFLNSTDLSFVLFIKFGNILAINSASISSSHCLFSLFLEPYDTYADHLIVAHICWEDHLTIHFTPPSPRPFSIMFLWCQALSNGSIFHLSSLTIKCLVSGTGFSFGSISYPLCLLSRSSFNIYALE